MPTSGDMEDGLDGMFWAGAGCGLDRWGLSGVSRGYGDGRRKMRLMEV